MALLLAEKRPLARVSSPAVGWRVLCLLRLTACPTLHYSNLSQKSLLCDSFLIAISLPSRGSQIGSVEQALRG